MGLSVDYIGGVKRGEIALLSRYQACSQYHDKVMRFAPEISVLEPVEIRCFTVSETRG